MTNTVISYPIPVYQNVDIQTGFYQPRQKIIEDIDLGIVTTVTTTEAVDYVVGQEVRLLIPAEFGSYQLNGKTAFIIDIPAEDQVTLNLDSSHNVDAFIAFVATPTIFGYTVAQIVAIGDVNTGNIGASGRVNQPTFVPGSFLNISPE